jgi:hypothetical protein
MIRKIIFAAAIATFPVVASAQDAKLTVEQCINILSGLNALNCVGQELNDYAACKPDSKQYKLGAARVAIAVDVAALTPVGDGANKEQQAFISDLPPLPAIEPGKTSSARDDAVSVQNKALGANWQKIISGPCPVTPGRIKFSDLNVGDGADQNPIPPTVLSHLVPLIDGLK